MRSVLLSLPLLVVLGCKSGCGWPPFGSSRRVTSSEIAELQKWADDHGVRNDLESWVTGARGVIYNSSTSVVVEYGPGGVKK